MLNETLKLRLGSVMRNDAICEVADYHDYHDRDAQLRRCSAVIPVERADRMTCMRALECSNRSEAVKQ